MECSIKLPGLEHLPIMTLQRKTNYITEKGRKFCNHIRKGGTCCHNLTMYVNITIFPTIQETEVCFTVDTLLLHIIHVEVNNSCQMNCSNKFIYSSDNREEHKKFIEFEVDHDDAEDIRYHPNLWNGYMNIRPPSKKCVKCGAIM